MVDTVKILGSLLSSGILSKGSGNNVLGNLLGAVLGGNQQSSSMIGMLGSLLGSNSQQSGGGIGGLLGSLMGAQQQRPQQQGGGIGDLLGSLMGGAQQRPQQQGGGIGDLLGSLMGGAQQRPATPAQGGGIGDLLGSLMGGNQNAATNGGTPDLGSLLGGAVTKYLGTQTADPQLKDLSNNFLPPQVVNQQAAQDQATLLIRTMINAAKADGQIDSTEQDRILSKIGDLTAEEANFIRSEFQAPLDVNAFIRSIPQGMGQQIYTVSLMAIDLDTKQEAQYLLQLAQGLQLSPQLCNQIHEQVGAPKLYA